MSRVAVITGATGFIGWHVARQFLVQGWAVRGLVRPGSPRPLPEGVERVEAPLSEAAVRRACTGAAAVVHLAALIRAKSAAEFASVNVEATRAMARAALAAGARLVHTSSLGVTGPGDPAHPPSEDAPPRPINAYGESKRRSELAVREVDGLEWTILRPTLVYGPRDRLFLPVFRMARLGVFPMPQPNAAYNLVHVADVARAFEIAASSPTAIGEVFFVGHPENTSVFDMLRTAAAALQTTVRPVRIPRLLLQLAATAGSMLSSLGISVPVDRARLAELQAPGFVCDVTKARARLGFEAAIGLPEGFQETVEWYRREGWLA